MQWSCLWCRDRHRRVPETETSFPPGDFLKPEAGRQVEVIHRKIARLVPRLEPSELETEEERSRRTPFDVSFTHEIPEPAVGQNVGVLRVVDAASAAEHPSPARAEVQLAPTAFRVHRRARNAGVLPHGAPAQARDRLTGKCFADELDRTELQPGVERDGAGCEQRVAGQRVESAQPTDVPADG